MTNAQKKEKSRLSSRLLLFAMIGLALAVYACYPGGATDISDYDMVITLYEEGYDYTVNKTYAMPDTVVVRGDTTLTIQQSTEDIILGTVRANMANFGYTQIVNPDSTVPDSIPDVIVICSALTQDFAAFTTWPWWGGWWGGWGGYPPGWGWGYPSGGVSVNTFTVGAVLIDMATPEEVDPGTVNGIWSAGLNSLLSNSLQADQMRIEDSVNQAFEQSPYLDTN